MVQNNNRSRIDKNFLSEIRKINNQDIQQFTINTLLEVILYKLILFNPKSTFVVAPVYGT